MRGWWCRLWSPLVPRPWPEGAWHCPTCGRVLVGGGRPGRGFSRWETMTRAERVQDCLVDGTPLAEGDHQALPPEQIRARALAMAATLDRRWAKRLRSAVSLYEVAHYLIWLRADRCVKSDTAEINRLLYAIGLLLPTEGPRSRPPLVYAPWRW